MEDFYKFFCEVQFLCYEGDPNWLGWIVIAIIGVMALNLFMALLMK